MLEESTNTGVTPEVSATSAGGDSGSPVVPQTAGAVDNSDPNTTVDGAAPPAADEIPENDDDLANLSEMERTPLVNQRNRIRELNKWRTGAEPVVNWAESRGGMERIQADAQMVDHLFSADLETRRQGYTAFQNEDPAAFDRLITDVIDTPWVQDRFLERMDPQAVLDYAQRAGLIPDDVQVDPAVSASIPNELREAWNLLPAAVRDEYSRMSPDVRNWNLKRDAQIHNGQKAERERVQAERTHAINQQKTKVYQDVRSIIQSALAEKIPGSDEATSFVLDVTESAMLNDPECAALWNELSAHIEKGEGRSVREKLPLVIAKAKAIATQKASWLNERESKARQFDELMRKASQDEILAYVAQMRGGMKQPGPGSTPAPSNGSIPKPDAVGQYDRANILSYHPAHRQ